MDTRTIAARVVQATAAVSVGSFVFLVIENLWFKSPSERR